MIPNFFFLCRKFSICTSKLISEVLQCDVFITVNIFHCLSLSHDTMKQDWKILSTEHNAHTVRTNTEHAKHQITFYFVNILAVLFNQRMMLPYIINQLNFKSYPKRFVQQSIICVEPNYVDLQHSNPLLVGILWLHFRPWNSRLLTNSVTMIYNSIIPTYPFLLWCRNMVYPSYVLEQLKACRFLVALKITMEIEYITITFAYNMVPVATEHHWLSARNKCSSSSMCLFNLSLAAIKYNSSL